MSVRMMQAWRIAGLLLGLGCLAACDGDGGTAPVAGGGAGIPNHRGPANSKMPTKGAGKGSHVQGPGTAAPAPGPGS